MSPGPLARPLIQILLKKTQTQPRQSLPAAPDILLMVAKKMLIRTTGTDQNVHDVDLVVADDLLILISINLAFLRQTWRTSWLL